MVVIDEVPEVTNDDPAFLFEQNDGFQEVTSKRTIRSKQKAQQEIELMKQKELTKKSVSKVLNEFILIDFRRKSHSAK